MQPSQSAVLFRGKCYIYCKVPKKNTEWLMLKRPELSEHFQGRDCEGKVEGEYFGEHDELVHSSEW